MNEIRELKLEETKSVNGGGVGETVGAAAEWVEGKLKAIGHFLHDMLCSGHG